ncbi:MAG: glycine cleavage system protein H [Anaerolineae bacterium]
MPEFLELTVDKFTFKVATDRYYHSEGVWAQAEASSLPLGEEGPGVRVRIGLSDFLQQRSGDVAFVEVEPEGAVLAFDDELAVIETIKADVSLASPVAGKVVEVNPAMETAPEVINQDPYGEGWLAVIEASDWESDRARLLDAQAYFFEMKREAEEEAKKL